MTTATGAYATAATVKARLGITDAAYDTPLGLICDQVNQYIETYCGRPIAPVTSATYTIDVDEETDRLYFPRGIRAVSALSVAHYTGAARVTLTEGTDFYLRPLVQDRDPGWPATEIVLSDRCTTFGAFPEGFEIVSMTATTGWASIPDDVTEVAVEAAAKAWRASQSGMVDVAYADESGDQVMSAFLSPRNRDTLRRYRSGTATGMPA